MLTQVYLNLQVDHISLQYTKTDGQLFFILWTPTNVHMNSEGMICATFVHPVTPKDHPKVDIEIDPWSSILCQYKYRENGNLRVYAFDGMGYCETASRIFAA